MLAAAAHVVSERGYGGMSVSRITCRAGVSRRTFYDAFEDREDCFLAVFDGAVERATGIAGEAYEAAGGGWQERARAGLGALLAFFDDEPDLGTLLVVDALAAGRRVLERRARVVERIAWTLEECHAGRSASGTKRERRRAPPLTAEGVVSAVLGVIHARMLSPGRPSRLTGLLNDLTGMIVLPYLGPTAAKEELRRTPPRPSHPLRTPARDPLEALPMRLTSRTLQVLAALVEHPGASNRRVGELAGVHDQGQISKLLARLQTLELIHNSCRGQPRGEPNAWTLTPKGREIEQAIHTRTSG
jgi:AcrR family transcriptional regulator/DNA-binding MarR family transcriptional regulator